MKLLEKTALNYCIFIIPLLLLTSSPAQSASTLKTVKKRNMLHCGVSSGLTGFAIANSQGKWEGIDVDVCRAVAAAVLKDSNKVKYIGLSAQQRFTAIQSGEVDLLSRNTTNTLQRDTSLGLNFAPVVYYDGQGFIVRKKDGIKMATKMKGATVCTQQGTTTELNLADFSRKHGLKLKAKTFESREKTEETFIKGQCDAYTTDVSGLAAFRALVKNPNAYIILPEIISKEPLAPAVRHGDDTWFDVVKWSVYTLITAEELGINSKNVNELKKSSKDPKIQRLLGSVKGNGKSLGLDENWAYRIIKMVGNYGEIYEQHLGSKSALKLKRGLNALWNSKKPGLMYAPPMR